MNHNDTPMDFITWVFICHLVKQILMMNIVASSLSYGPAHLGMDLISSFCTSLPEVCKNWCRLRHRSVSVTLSVQWQLTEIRVVYWTHWTDGCSLSFYHHDPESKQRMTTTVITVIIHCWRDCRVNVVIYMQTIWLKRNERHVAVSCSSQLLKVFL